MLGSQAKPWKEISTWEQLVNTESELDTPEEEWAFRGQSHADWNLQTSLDRTCDDFNVAGTQARFLEDRYFVDFKRFYSIYAPESRPAEDDTLEWLSLLRHYGGPSRLLDFTFSFFIATYFALERAKKKSAVWAVSKTWLTRIGQNLMEEIGGKDLQEAWGQRKGSAFETIFWKQDPPRRFVYPTSPYRINERLAAQQGLFLCPADVGTTFEENLFSMQGSDTKVRKIILEGGEARKMLLLKLHRAGISRATLFPGLDGYAQSLHTKTALFLDTLKKQETGARGGPNL